MGKLTVLALRVVLCAGLAGSLFVQGVMVPLLADDLEDVDVRVPVLVIVVRGTVFSHAAFRYVDVVFGAIVVASLLAFALGVTLAPGEGVAPGVVLLIGGAAVLVAGVALVVLVLRMLLAQAVALDAETKHLQAELSEVI